MKRTKIVATIGPASESAEILGDMIENGLNVCRLNFSHNDYQWHKKTIAKIWKISKQKRKHIGIMADIQGPRIRVASRQKFEIEKGDKIFVTDQKSHTKHRFKKELILDWDDFYSFVHLRDKIFIEDGLMELKILKRAEGGCVAEVLTGGIINPRKGVNIPSISKHLGFLTSKDLNDLEFIMSQGVDFVAASFVSSGKDIINLRNVMTRLLEKHNKKNGNKKLKMPWIVAKMENQSAIRNLDNIVKEIDVAMVARGDLAIEMPQEKVSVFQKRIIKNCIKNKKPVIVATQMMASMVENARPTRAEVSDVTNAVIDQTDAVMLSGESASGKYPREVIRIMSKILKTAEDSPYNDLRLKKTNQFARMIDALRNKKKKKGARKIIQAKTLKEAIGLAVLRQEDVKIHLDSRKDSEKNKASVIWGVS